MSLIHPYRFASIDDTLEYTFSLRDYQWEPVQTLRNSYQQGVGASFANRSIGYAPAPMNTGQHAIRTKPVLATPAATEQEIANASATCQRIGVGYLYRILDDSSEQRCLATLVEMPRFTMGVGQFRHSNLNFRFEQLGHWKAITSTTGSQLIDATSETFDITVGGDLRVIDAIFRFRANDSSTPMTGPIVFTNAANGMSFTLTKTFTNIDEEERILCGYATAEYSSNNGTSYANDHSAIATPATQVPVMFLEPDQTNSITVTCTGTPNWNLEWEFFDTFA